MTNDKIRIAIAESLGWDIVDNLGPFIGPDKKLYTQFPNYPESLDACREFRKALTSYQHADFVRHLREIIAREKDIIYELVSAFDLVDAEPGWQNEAYLRTISKWKD